MKRVVLLVFALGLLGVGRADLVYDIGGARLQLAADGTAVSLTAGTERKELIASGPFFAIKKEGRLVPASAIVAAGDLLRVRFGQSGVEADFRVRTDAGAIVVQLEGTRGGGIEELRLAQLRTSLPNTSSVLAARWNQEFTVSFMALNERVNAGVESGGFVAASVYPEYGMSGAAVAILVAPNDSFLDRVEKAERDFKLPTARLGGMWGKRSEDVRTSYLFTDLTESNVDATIAYTKLAGFRYILIYSSTWSSSLGSYPINAAAYPHGEAGLKAVVDKCHAAGLKVGVHLLTSLVGKNDPLVRPVPDHRLLSDLRAVLGADIGEADSEIPAAAPVTDFPTADAFYGTAIAGRDVLIDDEIVQYRRVEGSRLVACARGVNGTRPARHRAGAQMFHLAERYGSYLADLRTPLKEAIADRVAGLINRCGLDMIYFDGGELNAANGPFWYWGGVQQMAVWERVKRDLLVQGPGMTHWTWHVYARGTCDDFAAVAPKQFLDFHKIADTLRDYRNEFLPAELGWWGILQDAPDHPATSPDEAELHAVRMLALDLPISIETTLDALRANGRTEEMLKMLGAYERLRLGRVVSPAARDAMRTGEWHMTADGRFEPIRYDARLASLPGDVTIDNAFGRQPLQFRLQAEPTLAPIGDARNVVLLGGAGPTIAAGPAADAAMPGALANRVDLGAKPVDLAARRALAIDLAVDTASSAVLNVQLEGAGKRYRDYYVDLDFAGARHVVLPEATTERLLPEFRPPYANYPFKMAMYGFPYDQIVAVNFRWMRYPKDAKVTCRMARVEALAEGRDPPRDVWLTLGGARVDIPGALQPGDYVEFQGGDEARIYDRNGHSLRGVAVLHPPTLEPGPNRVTLGAADPGRVKLTVISHDPARAQR